MRWGPACRITNLLESNSWYQGLGGNHTPGRVGPDSHRRRLTGRLISKWDGLDHPLAHPLLRCRGPQVRRCSAWDRRSLLTGSSRGGPSRRDIKSVNHTLPGHRRAMRSSITRSRRTLSRTPGREQSDREKSIQTKPRPRLHHHVQSERSWMREGEPEWTVRCLSRRKQIHLCLAELPPYQLHRMSAPKLWVPEM